MAVSTLVESLLVVIFDKGFSVDGTLVCVTPEYNAGWCHDRYLASERWILRGS